MTQATGQRSEPEPRPLPKPSSPAPPRSRRSPKPSRRAPKKPSKTAAKQAASYRPAKRAGTQGRRPSQAVPHRREADGYLPGQRSEAAQHGNTGGRGRRRPRCEDRRERRAQCSGSYSSTETTRELKQIGMPPAPPLILTLDGYRAILKPYHSSSAIS